MTLFSFLACLDCFETDMGKLEQKLSECLLSVKKEMAFTDIAWGPVAFKKGLETQSESLVYAVKNTVSRTLPGSHVPVGSAPADPVPEYTIAIRGTNPCSIFSWIFQDLNVGRLVPWSRQSPSTKGRKARISKATDTSLAIHKKLESGGKTVLSWLLEIADAAPGHKITVNVTGHSLGGCMCTAFATYLHDEISALKPEYTVDIRVYALAGPTAGDEVFAQYAESIFGESLNRYTNRYDIATHVWSEADMNNFLPAIYSPRIELKALEKDALNYFCKKVKNLGYTQPGAHIDIPSIVFDVIPFRDYLMQAVYQHVIPYFESALKDSPRKVIDIIFEILKNLFSSGLMYDSKGNAMTAKDEDRRLMVEAIETLAERN